MNRSGKYELMRVEYITGDDTVTYAALGNKYGRSPGSVGEIAKKEGWVALRAEHRAAEAEKVNEQLSQGIVGRLVGLRTKFVDATEKTIDAYIEAVGNKTITPNATDVSRLMMTLRDLSGGNSSPEEGNVGISISESLGRDFLRALEATARTRATAGAVETAPQPKLVGSSEG